MTVAAGVVVVRKVNNEWLYLLLRNRNYYEAPKGRSNSGEDLFDTALRETQEETGLTSDDLDFKWGRISTNTDTYKSGTKYVVYFLAETTKADIELKVNPELGHPEHQGYVWANYEDARLLVNDRIGKVLEWAKGVIE